MQVVVCTRMAGCACTAFLMIDGVIYRLWFALCGWMCLYCIGAECWSDQRLVVCNDVAAIEHQYSQRTPSGCSLTVLVIYDGVLNR